MFRKPDDDLFSRIFDDGQAGDTRMEWLRDGLKELREVPPHGLSNERLRDQLLGTGLSPVKSATVPWWSWAWAPVAAAALAVVVLPRLASNPEPQLMIDSNRVAMDSTALTRPTVESSGPRGGIRFPESSPYGDLDIDATLAAAAMEFSNAPSGAVRSDRPTFRRSTRAGNDRRPVRPAPRASRSPRIDPGLVASVSDPRKEIATGPVAVKSDPSDAAFAPDTGGTSREQTSYPLVLLASEIDAATGAASATEVTSPANLSVGG